MVFCHPFGDTLPARWGHALNAYSWSVLSGVTNFGAGVGIRLFKLEHLS